MGHVISSETFCVTTLLRYCRNVRSRVAPPAWGGFLTKMGFATSLPILRAGRKKRNYMNLRWWEKTVEYKFVMLVAQAEKLFLAPLDGNHERAGDAMFSSSNRWVLIEFKKDKDSIREEKRKFIQYEQAKKELESSDGHHHMVYGHVSKEKTPQKLDLHSQTYFSGRSCSKLQEILSSGISHEKFADYIAKFTKFKKEPGGGSSDGDLSIGDYELVAGLNSDNKIVECLSLAEFQRQLDLEHEHDYDHDGPSL